MYLSLEIIGNVGNDASINQVGDYNVINFNVAHSESYTNAENQKIDRTTWISCSLWIKKGNSTKVADYLKKGQLLRAEGLPSVDTYVNKDNKTIPQLRLRVDKIKLLGGKKDTTQETPTASDHGPGPVPVTAGTASDDDLPF